MGNGMLIPKPTLELSEKELDTVLFGIPNGLAWQLGWRHSYHTYRSTRSPSGFPDRVIARDRAIFIELKAEGNKPTAAQKEWLTGLANAQAEVYLWTPTDIEEAALVLTMRHDPLHPPMGKAKQIPRSRWHSDGERMDTFMPDLPGLVRAT